MHRLIVWLILGVLENAHFVLIDKQDGLFGILGEPAHYLGSRVLLGPSNVAVIDGGLYVYSALFLSRYRARGWHCCQAVNSF